MNSPGAPRERKIQFGLNVPQVGMTAEAMLKTAALAEHLGFHSLWLFDHMWQPYLPEADCFDCAVMMSAIAARTERLRIGTLVMCNSFRNPALLAKMLATIDHVSGGRLEVGMGAGWAEEEYRAYGYEFPPIAVRLRQLSESLRILKAMFTESRPSFHGRYYSIVEAPNNPKPVQKPHPPITVGGTGEKVLLRIVARYADRWSQPLGLVDFARKLEALRGHCAALGRDPDSLEISEQLLMVLGSSADEVAAKWQIAQRTLRRFASAALRGTPDQIVAQLKERVARGTTFFTILLSDFAAPTTIELFAREVFPAFR